MQIHRREVKVVARKKPNRELLSLLLKGSGRLIMFHKNNMLFLQLHISGTIKASSLQPVIKDHCQLVSLHFRLQPDFGCTLMSAKEGVSIYIILLDSTITFLYLSVDIMKEKYSALQFLCYHVEEKSKKSNNQLISDDQDDQEP